MQSARNIPLADFVAKLERLIPYKGNDSDEMLMIRTKARIGIWRNKTVANLFTRPVKRPPSRPSPEMLTAAQVAELFGVTRACVYAWVTAGKLPPGEIVRHGRLWPKDLMEKLVAERWGR